MATKAKTPPAEEPMTIDLPLLDGTTRQMPVRVPTEEQLAVWQTNAERFTQMGADWQRREAALADKPEDHPDRVEFGKQKANQAARGLARALRIINSVLANEEDRYWVEDQLMDGHMNLEGALSVMTLTVDELRKRRHATAPKSGPKASLSR